MNVVANCELTFSQHVIVTWLDDLREAFERLRRVADVTLAEIENLHPRGRQTHRRQFWIHLFHDLTFDVGRECIATNVCHLIGADGAIKHECLVWHQFVTHRDKKLFSIHQVVFYFVLVETRIHLKGWMLVSTGSAGFLPRFTHLYHAVFFSPRLCEQIVGVLTYWLETVSTFEGRKVFHECDASTEDLLRFG